MRGRRLLELTRKLKMRILMYNQYKKPTVLFTSFGGQYNDNPKYISEKLHDLYADDVDIIWAVSDKNKDELPPYIHIVEYKSDEYEVCSRRSHILVDNSVGYRWRLTNRNKWILRRWFSTSKQLNISTWHGTPIKKIGRDEYHVGGKTGFISSCDYMIAGCEYTRDRLQDAFYPIEVRLCGTPRNDILINSITEEQRRTLKNKLGLPISKNIVLFAPTFRTSNGYSGENQMKSFDIARILAIFNHKFPNSDWVFMFRVHHEVLMNIDVDNLTKQHRGRIINGNLHDDMAEYLAVTDALITDYSSSLIDFALTKRPCFLYVPDKEHYINDERGTYIPLEELPYPYATDLDGFYELLENYDEQTSLKRIDDFNRQIGNVETGRSAEYLASEIINFINTGRKKR